VHRAGGDSVEQSNGAGRTVVSQADGPAGPIRVWWGGVVDEQRLVDPRAGVEESGPALRSLPARVEIARERAKSMYVTEENPIRVDAESPDHVRERGEARETHLRAQGTCGEACHPGAQQAVGAERHRRGPDQLSQVFCQRGEWARERLYHPGFEASERRPSGQLVVDGDRAGSRDASEETARHAERGLG